MRILLADDETQVLKQLELLIDWPKYGYELFLAKNGREVTKLLETEAIDLLCLDINMPLMNGFEVLSWIDAHKIKIEVVVISCQDDFAVVKKAMKHRVLDYILKNTITAENILRTLDEVKQKMAADYETSSKLIEIQHQAKQKAQSDLNNQFKYWITKSNKEGAGEERLFLDHQPFSNYKMFTLKMNNYQEIVQRYASNNINEFYDLIENIFRNIFKKFEIVWFRTDDFTFSALIQFHQSNQAECHSKIRELHQDLYRVLSISSFVLIGESLNNLNRIKETFWSTERLATICFFYGENSLVFNEEIKIEQNPSSEIYQFMKASLPILESKNFQLFELMVENALKHFKETKVLMLKQDFLACIRNLFFLAAQSLGIESPLFNVDQVNSVETMMIRLRQYFLNYTPSEAKHSHNYIVLSALNYIKEHYHEDLSLSSIALAQHISPAYLSRVFSSVQGTSIVNYIAEYRIEVSKRLILETNLKFYDIATKVGFISAITFSTTFKKVTGRTPGQYREQKE